MAVCKNCGIDHAAEAMDDVENYAHLENAWDALADANNNSTLEESREWLPPHVSKFFRKIVSQNQDTFLHYVQQHGVVDGPDIFVGMMMEVAFCVGVLTSSRYQKMPTYSVTEGDVEQVKERLLLSIEAHEKGEHEGSPLDQIKKAIAAAGIDMERVHIVDMGEMPMPGSASDDDEKPNTGLYL